MVKADRMLSWGALRFASRELTGNEALSQRMVDRIQRLVEQNKLALPPKSQETSPWSNEFREARPWLRKPEKIDLSNLEKSHIAKFFGSPIAQNDFLHAATTADNHRLDVKLSDDPEGEPGYGNLLPSNYNLEKNGWNGEPALVTQSYHPSLGRAFPVNPHMFSSRVFFRDRDGKIRVYNNYFTIGKHGYAQGLRGRDIIRAQVEALRRLGAVGIHSQFEYDPSKKALGFVPKPEFKDNPDPNNPDHWVNVGYIGGKVWPLFGFGGQLSEHYLKSLPRDIVKQMGGNDVRNLLDLRGGKEMWAARPATVYNGYMDLDPESRTGKAHDQAWAEFESRKSQKSGATHGTDPGAEAEAGRGTGPAAKQVEQPSSSRPANLSAGGSSVRLPGGMGQGGEGQMARQPCRLSLAQFSYAAGLERGDSNTPPVKLDAEDNLLAVLLQEIKDGRRPRLTVNQRRDLEEQLSGLNLLINDQKGRGIPAPPDEVLKRHMLNVILGYPVGALVLQRYGLPCKFKKDKFYKPENYDKIQDLPDGRQVWAGANDWENGWSWAGIHGKESRDENGYVTEPEQFLEVSHKGCPGCHGDNDPTGRTECKKCQEFAKEKVKEWLKEMDHPVRFTKPGWPDAQSDFASALERLQSANHLASIDAISRAFNAMALKPHKIGSVLHNESGGTSPAVAASINRPTDLASAHYAAAWMGQLGRQNAILAFQSHPEGKDSLYQMDVAGSGNDVSNVLDGVGVPQRILIPKSSGFKVLIHDPGRVMRSQVAAAAKKFGTTVGEIRGDGTIIGGDDPHEAREQYRNTIRNFESGAS